MPCKCRTNTSAVSFYFGLVGFMVPSHQLFTQLALHSSEEVCFSNSGFSADTKIFHVVSCKSAYVVSNMTRHSKPALDTCGAGRLKHRRLAANTNLMNNNSGLSAGRSKLNRTEQNNTDQRIQKD